MDERQHISFRFYYCINDSLQFDRILNAASIFFSFMFPLNYTICALINEHVRKHVNLPSARVYFSYSGVYFSTYVVRGCTVIKGCYSMYFPMCQGVRLFGTVRLLGR